MPSGTDLVHNALQQLAAALLDEVEAIAKRVVARMQTLLPGYAEFPAEELLPTAVTNTRNLIEAVVAPRGVPMAEGHFWESGRRLIRQGITADDLIQGWRMGVESVAEEARMVAERLGIPDHVLREFVEATLQWADLGTRISAQAPHREAQIRELERLAAEQAALRRVATLVAQEVPPSELFGAVAREVGMLFSVDYAGMVRYEPDPSFIARLAFWAAVGELPPLSTRSRIEPGDLPARVADTGNPVRVDDWARVRGPAAEYAREVGMKSAVAGPIVVNGNLWGALAVGSKRGPLPRGTESRLLNFAELVATAIANAEARSEVQRLADEQATLRRVAELVAQEVPPSELFGAVTREVGTLFGVDYAGMVRYEADPRVIAGVALWAAVGELPPRSTRSRIEPGDLPAMVADTGKPARVDDWANGRGPTAEFARALGVKSSVAGPIVVNGNLWGALAVHSKRGTLPPDTESRLLNFAELVATAIANAHAREEVRHLADEQAALRRVAELVAQEVPPSELFGAVVREVGTLFGVDYAGMIRYESDRRFVIWTATWAAVGEHPPRPTRSRVVPGDQAAMVIADTGKPARVDDWANVPGPTAEFARELGVKSSVAGPIVVNGNLWGALAVHSKRGTLPLDTESRLLNFAELVATAIANAEARSEVQRLADEQAALRRVATLVAQGAPPSAVFDAVAAEMTQLLGADGVTLSRYEPGDEVTLLAHRGPDADHVSPGTRTSHADGESVTAKVWRTERPARFEHVQGAPGAVSALAQQMGVRAAVGAPIVVDRRLWGCIIANWRGEESPQADTEERMVKFAELLDTAIANADSRDQLTASRARLVTEADEARRRVVRDLHDGAQQRLVHTIVTLKHAQLALRANDDEKAESLLAEALERAQHGNAELRELAHGILPAVLTQGGLRSGVNTIVGRLDLPVEVDIPATRFQSDIEASAYFVVAEALTNVVKHSHARRAEVRASVDDRSLHVEVRDDGVGGVDPHGRGLVGLADRVSALGGRLEVQSPSGGGTLLSATLPLSIG